MVATVLGMWQTGDTEHLATMADDAIFSSPVADYRGDEAVHIIGLVARTMDDIEVTKEWNDGHGDTVTAFTARVGGDPVDGLVREQRDAHSTLTHVTLFLRPLHTLEEAITHIRALRREHPVPARSGRRREAP